MKATSPRDFESKGCDFGQRQAVLIACVQINPRHPGSTLRRNPMVGKPIDCGLFEASNQRTHRQSTTAQVQQHVHHGLARTVISDLTTPFNPNNRGWSRIEQVLGTPGEAECEYRVMFNQP